MTLLRRLTRPYRKATDALRYGFAPSEADLALLAYLAGTALTYAAVLWRPALAALVGLPAVAVARHVAARRRIAAGRVR